MSQSTVTLGIAGTQVADAPLPSTLQTASRGVSGPTTSSAGDAFINPRSVKTKAVFDLPRPARGSDAPPRSTQALADDDVVALEAADGTTIFMRADRLRDEAARLMPHAFEDGRLNIDQLRDLRTGVASRAAAENVGDWLWRKVSVLEMQPDSIIDAARQLLIEWLGDKANDSIVNRASLATTRLGTKALMTAIERRLPRGPGLYRWRDGTADKLEPVREEALKAAADKPLLIFIHGTGSNSAGSFGDLGKPGAGWNDLARRFGENIYAFEHYTFSESPIDNALALAAALPAGARLNIVSHSRGGLVGDLLCLASLDDALIKGWNRAAQGERAAELRQVVAEEHAKLSQLRDLLNTRNFRIERYVRVACPARGTQLAGGNFDVFMSGLLNLVGLVPALAVSPWYPALKRIVLEIAHNRTDPAWVPGIEAMLPNSPLAKLLATAQRKQGVQMAVVAGDIEGGGVMQRIGVMFTDWMFFDKIDNDLVVDTDAMFAGLARRPGARYLFQQGAGINHFRYFDNAASRQAVKDWLTHDKPETLANFDPIPGDGDWAQREKSLGRKREAERVRSAPGTRPVVYVVPGIMGSHLVRVRSDLPPDAPPEFARDRIWFDLLGLAGGALKKIAWPAFAPTVMPDGLLEMNYGDCCRHLDKTHDVVPFPYDWRLSVKDEANRLADALRATLKANPDQPVRILAHSMGGLVTRAMIAQHPDVWQAIVARPGGRLVMMGTPNNGSHLMVEMLLGKGDTLRKLARIDITHDLQELLDIIAGFRGALQLLPRPGFVDTGATTTANYFDDACWSDYKGKVFDRWFGDHIVGVPAKKALDEARQLWDILPDNRAPKETDRVAYVFGSAEKTACGLAEENGALHLLGTPLGDGSVTWQSGRLDGLPDDRHWYMPIVHGDLLNAADHFEAITELLTSGVTRRLPQTAPRTRTADAPEVFRYDAGPTPIPSEEEMARSLLFSRSPRQLRCGTIHTLTVSVRAQDLRFAQSPVVCGHYRGDAISGAEDQLDRNVVDGALRQRNRLGMYAGYLGTSALALMPCSEEERRRGSQRGGLVVGLGEYGELGQRQLVDTIRAGTLRFLLHYQELHPAGSASDAAAATLTLSPLLIGFSSTSNLSLENSVEAIILGVAEANNQFAEARAGNLRIGRLEFTELFLDTATSAARALAPTALRLATALNRLDTRLELATELDIGMGARSRMQASSGDSGHWSRLMVTDADAAQSQCPDECFETHVVSAMPVEKCRERLGIAAPDQKTVCPEAPPLRLAERLKFVFLSTRARAESELQQRQPGLIEVLVKKSITSAEFNLDHCRCLYELMVPLDFKGIAANTERLLLVVDGYTANLPWEMLVVDGQPLVVHTAMVRQLATERFRKTPRSTLEKNAYVVGNPSTVGFLDSFTQYERSAYNKDGSLVSLQGAEDEASAVAALLRGSGYVVSDPCIGGGSDALKVIGGLYRQHYRIIHIAAHGIFNAMDSQCRPRTGVVLSDGLMLTAAEIGQLEVVPDLVFLNCCHLGVADNLPRDGNRVAYSLARELIEMGVRCCVVAGWAVNDDAARLFAETLYTQMLDHNQPFGAAVFQARRSVYEQLPQCNTWGAYQAYGDPMFRFDPPAEAASYGDQWQPVTCLELIDAIDCETTHVNAKAGAAVAGADTGAEREHSAAKVQRWIERAPEPWHARPDVQYAVGRFFGDLGPQHFEAAVVAYRKAVECGDDKLTAPIKAIEQLANLEVRLGIERNDEALINGGLKRLQSLLIDGMQTASTERWALLGSAAKSAAQAKAGHPRAKWKDVAPLLEQARAAYAHDGSGEGASAVISTSPYHVINRLQLDALLGKLGTAKAKAAAERDAQSAADAARQRFAQSGDFFDAVMPVDADLTIRLIKGTLHGKARGEITDLYLQALSHVPRNQRQINSVIRQLRLLSRFIQLKSADDKAIATLDSIAHELEAAS